MSITFYLVGEGFIFHTVFCLGRYLSVCFQPGVEGAFDAPGAKTVIPRKVIGKFSIRLVPDQTPEQIEKQVRDHIDKEHKKRGSPNTVK